MEDSMGELILLLKIPLLCTKGMEYWPSNCAVDGGASTGAGVAGSVTSAAASRNTGGGFVRSTFGGGVDAILVVGAVRSTFRGWS